MNTVSISLPKKQKQQLDSLVKQFGFANRSEFIRALMRYISTKPEIINQAATYPFVSPKTTSSTKIINDFKKTNKYSKAFLKDLQEGLESSDYFTK